MDCKEAQALIPAYVNETIPQNRILEFIEHVRKCPQCKEELEIYYITFVALKKLDEDDTSYDLKGMLEKDMEEKEQWVKRKRNIRRMTIGVLTVILIIFVFLLLDACGYLEISDIISFIKR